MGNMLNKAPHCIGCGDPLTAGNKSEAHIIPNALGGRLAPDDLICKTCNGILDRAVDNALVKAFGGVQTLIDLPRQRGSNPAIDLRTESGRRVRVQPDGDLMISDIQYDEKVEGDRRMITIGAPTRNQVRQLLERAKKNNPEMKAIDVNDIVSKLQPPPYRCKNTCCSGWITLQSPFSAGLWSHSGCSSHTANGMLLTICSQS